MSSLLLLLTSIACGTKDPGEDSAPYIDSDDSRDSNPTIDDSEDPRIDEDGDGFFSCDTYEGDDCDCSDNDATINPEATEVCDEVDNNCDGEIDEGVLETFYQDADRDGYGDPEYWEEACYPSEGYVENDSDCNDNNNQVFPTAPQRLSGIANDCDDPTNQDLDSSLDGVLFDIGDDYAKFAIGDVNGDGVADVIVTSIHLYIFFGGEGLYPAGSVFTLEDADVEVEREWLAYEYPEVKDLDGDGIDDIIFLNGMNSVFAPEDIGDGSDSDGISIMYGREDWDSSYSLSHDVILDEEQLSDLNMATIVGASIYAISDQDVDGDEPDYPDFVMAADGGDLKLFPAKPYTGIHYAEDYFSLTIDDYFLSDFNLHFDVGNLNGDSHDDIICGDAEYSARSWVIMGSSTLHEEESIYLSALSSSTDFDFLTFSPDDLSQATSYLVLLSDLDQDGYDDPVISAFGEDIDSNNDAGAVYIAPGDELIDRLDSGALTKGDEISLNEDFPASFSGLRIEGLYEDEAIPSGALLGKRNLNSGPLPEMVIGSQTQNSVYVFDGNTIDSHMGSSLSVSEADHIIFEVTASSNSFGRYGYGAGDVDGDGNNDIIIADSDPGQYHLFFGGNSS